MKFSNCGQTCGQRRFLTSYRRGEKCCQPRRTKAFRVFRGLRPEPEPHAPKAGALPTALIPDIGFYSRMGQGLLAHTATHIILTSFSTFSRGSRRPCAFSPESIQTDCMLPTPGAGVPPDTPIPDIQVFASYHCEKENASFSCLRAAAVPRKLFGSLAAPELHSGSYPGLPGLSPPVSRTDCPARRSGGGAKGRKSLQYIAIILNSCKNSKPRNPAGPLRRRRNCV